MKEIRVEIDDDTHRTLCKRTDMTVKQLSPLVNTAIKEWLMHQELVIW